MRTILAYVLVVPLVQFCLGIGAAGTRLSRCPLAGLTSVSLRVKIAGFLGGVAGVALAVAFGYAVFRFIAGPDAYTIGAFLASTTPLLFPIRNNILHAKAGGRIAQRATRFDGKGKAARAMAEETQTGSR